MDANPQNVDAAKVAEVLEEDINLKKRLTDTLGVDVANVAASHRVKNQWFTLNFWNEKNLFYVSFNRKVTKKVVLRTVGRSHLMASFTWWNEAIIEVSAALFEPKWI